MSIDTGRDDASAVDAADGWVRWGHGQDHDRVSFNSVLGPLDVRRDPAAPRTRAIVRWSPTDAHVNLIRVVHGGAMATAIDVALFSAGTILGVIRPGYATTVDLSLQYLAGARTGVPVMIEVELARAATRLLFFRGMVRQAGTVGDAGPEDASADAASTGVAVVAFTAIVRRSAPEAGHADPYTDPAASA